jgi:hypothetical protein
MALAFYQYIFVKTQMMVMKDQSPDQAELEVADNDDLLKPSYN